MKDKHYPNEINIFYKHNNQEKKVKIHIKREWDADISIS